LTAPRGVLHPQPTPGHFEHRQIAPAPDLAPWVAHHWFVAWDLTGLPDRLQQTLPHPNAHLVVEGGAVRLWGVQRARFSKMLAGRGWAFGVKFCVAALPALWPGPASALTDRDVAGHDVLGDAALSLLAPALAADADALCVAAEALLRARLPAAPDACAQRLAGLVQRVAQDPGITSVDTLSRVAGVPVRQLQRDFRRHVGVSPKWVIARYRLHETLALLQSGAARPDAELAQRLGYFDQAHFIRDFRRVVGVSPLVYARSLAGRG
jgi:AraC-like DNA-binding protein